ncbi:MAG TPA: efflux RND transporter periplasmic adaptor subunit, partial [Candidatus Acidoferrum sp.]|nr:efflux RND transporter periplasmic adaptor subunit [Candidatus Acidoferrum sp.]
MRRSALIIALLAAGAAIVSIDTRWWRSSISQSVARGSEQAIPVVTDKARRADVPIYLSGLGTVQAFNSVLITSRVDGQIVKIRFEEGGDVHAGDVLVEIDRAPFEAALAQTEANKLKDQAQLDNARLDLARYTNLAKTGAATTQQLDTTRAQVAQTEASIKADKALIDTAQVQLNYTSIRSPIEGRVGRRLIDAGNIVRATDTTGIVTVNQIHPIFVS